MNDESTPLLSRSDFSTDARSKWHKNVSQTILLFCNCVYYFAYYGIVSNLVLFLGTQTWSTKNSLFAVYTLIATSYVLPIVTGWLSDTFISKYASILLGLILCLIAYCFFLFVARCPMPIPSLCACISANASRITDKNKPIFSECCSSVVFAGILTLSLGTGFIQSSLPLFGADQVFLRDEDSTVYFGWLYVSTNVGILFSFGLLSFIQQNFSFAVGYLIPACFLLFAVIVFASSFKLFSRQNRGEVDLCIVFRVLYDSLRNFIVIRRHNSKGALFERTMMESPSNLVDYAKIRYNGRFPDYDVENVKCLLKVLMLFCVSIPYRIIYSQIYSTFIVQALHMRLIEKNWNFTVPVSWLCLICQSSTIALILFTQKFRSKGSRSAQIMAGMSFAALAVAFAGLMDVQRVNIFHRDQVIQTIEGTTYLASNLSIFWQIPQYILLAASEVFLTLPVLEFAYLSTPKCFQSILMGLFYACIGISTYIGMAIFYVLAGIIKVQGDLAHDMHLFSFFYVLCFLQICSFCVVHLFNRYNIFGLNFDQSSETLSQLSNIYHSYLT